ncbi:MAG: hypothetical protein ACRC8K_24040 [Waterburya sp.]
MFSDFSQSIKEACLINLQSTILNLKYRGQIQKKAIALDDRNKAL